MNSPATPGLVFRTRQPRLPRRMTRRRSLPSLNEEAPNPQSQTVASDEAIQKISALESELALLRAQIAQIVLAQSGTLKASVFYQCQAQICLAAVWHALL